MVPLGSCTGLPPTGCRLEAVLWRVLDLSAQLMVAETVAAGHALHLTLRPGVCVLPPRWPRLSHGPARARIGPVLKGPWRRSRALFTLRAAPSRAMKVRYERKNA